MPVRSFNTVLGELTETVRPIVEAIEASPALTKARYDQYIIALERIAGQLICDYIDHVSVDVEVLSANASVYLAVGVALQHAGASKEGVQSALRVMGHL